MPSPMTLYRVDANGGKSILLADQLFIAGGLSWSPDGSQLAFLGGEPVQEAVLREIFVINRDGTNLRKFILYDWRYGLPEWAPDNQHLTLMFYQNDYIRTDWLD